MNRSFPCHLCKQTLTSKHSLAYHIKTVHDRPTPTGIRHPRPKYESGQPCPCTICDKVFPWPSSLSEHMTVHTGEKPHSCPKCNLKFRLKGSLRRHIKIYHLKDEILQNKLKLFKCRICGKEDFVYYSALRNHWDSHHGENVFKNEDMKPFACGICGKPYYLREGALICGLLGHDPTKFRKEMFKFKCPECPDEELFRFYNLSILRQHWYDKHPGKKLPGKYRAGHIPENCENVTLPKCKIDKLKMKEIKANGPPEIKTEYPLYTELDLLPAPVKQKIVVRRKLNSIKKTKTKVNQNYEVIKKPKSRYGVFTCTICGLKVCRKDVLQRHIQVVHNSGKYKMQEQDLLKNNVKVSNIGAVIIDVDTGVIVKQEVSEYEEKSMNVMIFNCRFCERKWPTIRSLRIHEVKMHLKSRSNVKKNRCAKIKPKLKPNSKKINNKTETQLGKVNVNDKAAINAILNFQSVKVQLTRF